jgi:TolB-like protein
MSLFAELKRRKVPQAAVAYLAGAWLLLQIIDTVIPYLGLSDAVGTNAIIILAIGFAPAMIVAWVFEWTPQGLVRDSDIAPGEARPSTTRIDQAIIVLLVVAVGYFAADKFLLRESGVPARDLSVIVLPFANMSSDPEQEYFADGMSEELLNLLARVEGLRVISRSTAWTFKGKEVDVPTVRELTGVTHVLEGSVRRAGDEVRITAQLIDARNDAHVWSETYDGTMDDIFALQDRVSGQIISALHIRLLGNVPSAQVIDRHAYELYLQARHIIYSESGNTSRPMALLQEALEIEPDYVPALFELAGMYEMRPKSSVDEMQQDKQKSAEIVGRLAKVAPDSSYANVYQAWIAMNWDRDPQAAAEFLEKAWADDPLNPPHVMGVTSRLLAHLGRSDEAFAVARYNAARDPACIICASTMAGTARIAGRTDEAAKFLESLLEWYTPGPYMNWEIGAALLEAGRPAEALEHFDAILALGDDTPDGVPGDLGRLMALYDLGRLEDFEQEFTDLRAANPGHFEGIARVYAWTGQTDEALVWLEKEIEEQGVEVLNYLGPQYNRLREEPEFVAFQERHGIREVDFSKVEFDPPYPPEIRQEIERIRKELATVEAADRSE